MTVRARNFDEAIRKAEEDAKNYSMELPRYRNCFGQLVRKRYLGLCDAFEMDCESASVAEVFSEMRLIPSALTKKNVARLFFGPKTTEWELQWRARFEPWFCRENPPWKPKGGNHYEA